MGRRCGCVRRVERAGATVIRVTVELVSAVDPSRSRLLGVATICNDGTGTVDRCDYDASFSKWAPKQDEAWKRSRVTGFTRQTRGAWDLLYLALRNAVGSRNSTPTSTPAAGRGK